MTLPRLILYSLLTACSLFVVAYTALAFLE